jgi:outer membrane protein assembly factor BamD (BamD/ComL family)
MIVSTTLVFLISYVVYVKIRERITGIPEVKRIKGKPKNAFDKLREIISA